MDTVEIRFIIAVLIISVPIGCGGGGGSAASATSTRKEALSYSTNFPSPVLENPISEGGVWTTGLATGKIWKDPATVMGLAFGTQVAGTPPPYDDSIAHLSGFPPNHYAKATMFRCGAVVGLEVELLLRFKITPNNARGYEIDGYLGGSAIHVVRWNGAQNDFTDLSGAVTNNVSFNDGDVWYAEMVGNVITVKNNGLLVWTSDRTGDAIIWSDGNPGLGFYTDTNLGAASPNLDLGWKTFEAGSL